MREENRKALLELYQRLTYVVSNLKVLGRCDDTELASAVAGIAIVVDDICDGLDGVATGERASARAGGAA